VAEAEVEAEVGVGARVPDGTGPRSQVALTSPTSTSSREV